MATHYTVLMIHGPRSMDLDEMERREAAALKERDVLRERLRHAELRYVVFFRSVTSSVFFILFLHNCIYCWKIMYDARICVPTYVCVCMCVYAHVYVRAYVCVSVITHACVCVYVGVCVTTWMLKNFMCVFMCIYLYVCMHVCMLMHVCMYVCMLIRGWVSCVCVSRVCVHVHNLSTYIPTQVYTINRAYIHTCAQTCRTAITQDLCLWK